MSKGFTVERNLNAYTQNPTYKIVSLEKEDPEFIAVVKQMKVWYPTEEAALKRCSQNQERADSYYSRKRK